MSFSTRAGVRGRRGIAVFSTLSMLIAIMPVLFAPLPALATPGSDGNPNLVVTECGLDVLFVIDETGSMNDNSGQEQDLQDAYTDFATALAGTASQMGVIEFSSYPETFNEPDPVPGSPDSARRVTPGGYVNPATIIDYPGGGGNATSTSSYQPGGYTNWQEALWEANNFATQFGTPDLLIFFTDGDPNTIDGSGFGTTAENDAASAAVPHADALKSAGVHMLGIGLGLSDGSSSETRLSSVTGDEQGSSGSPDITTDDYILLTSSSQIANALAEVADQICPTTLNVTKHVAEMPNADMNQPGDWNTASGWEFTITEPVAPSGIHGLSGTSDTTDGSGNAQFSWSNDERDETSSTTLDETIQQGFGIVGASCSSPDMNNGAPFAVTYSNGWAINGIPDRATVDCDVYNQGSFLTLDKTVINDDGGTATDGQFELTASGPVNVSGNDGFNAAMVPAGDYALSEQGPDGYTAGAWSCGNVPVVGITVTLAVGSHVLCEITNNDVPPTLTLIKEVDNSNGGSALPGEWTLTATRQGGNGFLQGTSGVSDQVMGGTYDLTESNGPAGYNQVGWECSIAMDGANTVTLASGDAVTCTVTNSSLSASLTLVKIVNNQFGTQEASTSWNLAADGPGPNDFNGNGGASQDGLPAGDYVLSETGPIGWTASAWSCPTASVVGNTVTLEIGDNVKCSITNTPNHPHLTLVKDLQLSQGANETESDFTLTADGPTLIEVPGADAQNAVENDAFAGTYTLSEDGPAGYSQVGGWVCVGGSQDGDEITLGVNEDAVCTVTNASDPAQVTLVKLVNNDHGGDLGPADFQLTLNDSDLDQGANPVVPNTEYTVSEHDVDGYSQVGEVMCTDDSDLSSVDHPFTLDEGQEITCTITNEDEPAAITVVKRFAHPTDVQPNDFDLTVTPNGGSAIDVLSGDLTEVDGNETYTVSESLPEGWSQLSLVCENGDLPVDHPVELANGQHVTCVITNGENPMITVVKTTDGQDAATFEFTGDVGEFSFDENGGSETFEVDPGLYDVMETPADFWSLTDVSCSEGASADLNGASASFDVGYGDHETCTFTNEQLPKTIEVIAEGVCDGPVPQLKWIVNPINFNETEVDITWLDIDPLDPLYQQLGQPLQGTMDWPGIVVDGGDVVDWPGWIMVDGQWVQDADGYEGTVPTAEIMFTINPDLIVIVDYPDCSEPPAQIIVEKLVEGESPQDFAFTFIATGFTLSDDTLAHSEQATSGDLPAGDGYGISETLPSGWEQVNAVCDDGSNPSSIELSAGEVVTCTFTNNVPDEVEPIEILPFTGLDSDVLLALAIVLAMAGGVALYLSRTRGKHEELDR